ncbi:GTPase-activating protein, partial [Quaeritorhiza haematococci]
MFLVIAAIVFLSNLLMNIMFGIASERLTERIRQLTFAAILRQDISFFDGENDEVEEDMGNDDSSHSNGKKSKTRWERMKGGEVEVEDEGGKGSGSGNGASMSVNTSTTTGGLTSALASDATKVQGASGATLGTILTVFTNLIGGIIVAFCFCWKLALVATSCLPLIVSAGIFRLNILTYFANKAKKAYQQSAQLATEAVANIMTVQSLTLERKIHDRYLEILHKPLMDAYRNAWTHTALYAVSNCVESLVNALVFWYGGAQLIAYEGYTVRQFFVVFIAIIFGSISAGRIFASAPDLIKAKQAGEDILRLLNRKPRIDTHSPSPSPSPSKLSLPSIKGTIEFQN